MKVLWRNSALEYWRFSRPRRSVRSRRYGGLRLWLTETVLVAMRTGHEVVAAHGYDVARLKGLFFAASQTATTAG
jgi:hypothetical protein